MRHDLSALRARIASALPEGLVVAEHTAEGHFYRVNDPAFGNPLYPSVTGKLQVLKDEGIQNFKMDRALEYVFAHHHEFTAENIMVHLEAAERMPADIFADAGDVGTLIHDTREDIFKEWIRTGERPADFQSFIGEERNDIRVVSATAALEKFCREWHYVPVATELMVYSHDWKTAGTLDDLGLMRIPSRKGDPSCEHEVLCSPMQNVDRCAKCDAKWKWAFVLIDLKSSNRFKDHYFFQVALYFAMLRRLTGLKPERCYILKVSKEDRTYKLEDLKQPVKIAQYANHLIKTNDGIDFIKMLRKDNQRNVITL